MRKRWGKNNALPELEKNFETGDNKVYEFKYIINSMMYSKEVEN